MWKNTLCEILKELIKTRTQNEKLNEEAVSHNLWLVFKDPNYLPYLNVQKTKDPHELNRQELKTNTKQQEN